MSKENATNDKSVFKDSKTPDKVLDNESLKEKVAITKAKRVPFKCEVAYNALYPNGFESTYQGVQICLIFDGRTVVENLGAIQKQHILSMEFQVLIQQVAADITCIHQSHLGIILHQQRHHAASKGIPENDQFPICLGIGIFNGQQRLAAA